MQQKDYDEYQENDTNSSRYSEPMNIDTGERASFHSACSPEENADNDKQQNNLAENIDNLSADLNFQYSDKNVYEPPVRGPEKGQYRDFSLAQHTYENTHVEKKFPQEFKKEHGGIGQGQKDARLGINEPKEIENLEDIQLAFSECIIKPKHGLYSDDRFKKKNNYELAEESGVNQNFEQETSYQPQEVKKIEKVQRKESGSRFQSLTEIAGGHDGMYEEKQIKQEKKAKEIDLEVQMKQLREKAQKEEQEKENARQRESLKQLELEKEKEKEREIEREKEKQAKEREKAQKERQKQLQKQIELERELERQKELEIEKEKERQKELEKEREREEREMQREIQREIEREKEREKEEKEKEKEKEKQREKEEKEKEKKREKERLAELQRLQEKRSSKNGFEEVKMSDKAVLVDEFQQQLSRTSSTNKSNKGNSMELYDNFVDEDTLYPLKKESARISKTIETQTNDVEFPSGYVTGLQSERVEIAIPETKVIRDGLIYTYLVYKIVTKLKDDDDKQTEFSVYRRYSDFDWLFENITNKYHGYIIPVPPPKNILTAFNKEGVEFSETRKKELAIFLRKCMQHPFLRNTPELNIFLSDERGFLDFKKKEQALNQSRKDSMPLLSNISKMLQGATKGKPYHLREIDGPEGDLYNYDVTFSNLRKRLHSFSVQKLEHLQLQKKETAALLSFTHQLESTLSRSRYSKLDKEFQKITSENISEIEDNAIKDLTDKIEIQLKDIISNVDAVTSAIERRNELAKELNDMHDIIEEKNLKFKKDFTNGEELEELKNEYERLKKKCQEASEILLKELKGHKERIDHDLGMLLTSVLNRKERYFKEVYNLWSQTCQE